MGRKRFLLAISDARENAHRHQRASFMIIQSGPSSSMIGQIMIKLIAGSCNRDITRTCHLAARAVTTYWLTTGLVKTWIDFILCGIFCWLARIPGCLPATAKKDDSYPQARSSSSIGPRMHKATEKMFAGCVCDSHMRAFMNKNRQVYTTNRNLKRFLTQTHVDTQQEAGEILENEPSSLLMVMGSLSVKQDIFGYCYAYLEPSPTAVCDTFNHVKNEERQSL